MYVILISKHWWGGTISKIGNVDVGVETQYGASAVLDKSVIQNVIRTTPKNLKKKKTQTEHVTIIQ